MYEIRMHGRGGQGVVMAAGMLASALVAEGWNVVAIPQFGFERRGAPVAAYLRIDKHPIRAMTNVYAPDCVICIDPTVGRAADIFAGIRPGGTLLLATARPLDELQIPSVISTVGLCDAVSIARGIFGRPITNTVMLGAFARGTGLVSLEALQQAIRDSSMRDAGLEQNMMALDSGYKLTNVHDLSEKVAV